jgi:hypothetical protein
MRQNGLRMICQFVSTTGITVGTDFSHVYFESNRIFPYQRIVFGDLSPPAIFETSYFAMEADRRTGRFQKYPQAPTFTLCCHLAIW